MVVGDNRAARIDDDAGAERGARRAPVARQTGSPLPKKRSKNGIALEGRANPHPRRRVDIHHRRSDALHDRRKGQLYLFPRLGNRRLQRAGPASRQALSPPDGREAVAHLQSCPWSREHGSTRDRGRRRRRRRRRVILPDERKRKASGRYENHAGGKESQAALHPVTSPKVTPRPEISASLRRSKVDRRHSDRSAKQCHTQVNRSFTFRADTLAFGIHMKLARRLLMSAQV